MLMEFFDKIFSFFIPIHIVKTDAEREAVFRFRYEIYIKQMHHVFMKYVDHEKKMAYDDEDNDPNTFLLYAGTASKILGTIRLKYWQGKNLNQKFRENYDTSIFGNIDNLTIFEASYFLIDKNWRAKLLLITFLYELYRTLLKHNTDLVFLTCFPGLVKYYQKIGFRIYCSKLIYYFDALTVPLVGIPHDLNFIKEVKSALYPWLKKHLRKYPMDKKKKDLIKKLNNSINKSKLNVYSNKKEIGKMLEENFYTNISKSKLLNFISLTDISCLSSLILEVEANQVIFTSNIEDKEMYLILEGVMAVIVNQTQICELHSGDIFGEMAFFLPTGKRTASLQSITSAKLLVIRRNDVARCIKEKNEIATKFLLAISQILAIRLAETTGQLAETTLEEISSFEEPFK